MSCPTCGYAANIEAVVTPAPAAGATRRSTARSPSSTRRTRRRSTSLVDRLNAMRAAGRTDWTAADTLKNVVVTVTPPGGDTRTARDRRPRRSRRRPQAGRGGPAPGAGRALRRLRRPARPGEGLHRPAGHPDPLPGRPARHGRAPPGSPARTSPAGTRSTWCAGATSRPDGTIEAADVRAGDPCPACATAPLDAAARHRARATSSSSAAGTPTRSGSTRSAPTAGRSGSRWARYGIGISRAVAAIAEIYADERGLVWPRASRAVRRPRGGGRQRTSWTRRPRSAADLERAGPAGAAGRPARPVGRGPLRRRRADRHADHRRGRAPFRRGVRRGARPRVRAREDVAGGSD